MKRQILTLLIATMAVLTATAQKKIVVVVDGEEKLVTDVWRVDEIKFIDGDVKTLNDTPDTVDLGLSVRWADRNMGAVSPKDKGLLIGWGDTTLTNQSKKLQYFPIENADKDIYGGNYDIAKVKWGKEWHMPSQKEIQELIDKCTWTWDSENKGYIITRDNYDGSLFLPATGYRDGETEAVETAKGFYWTGSIATEGEAKLLQFDENGKPADLAAKARYMGIAIRPVTGALVMPLAIGEPTTSNITEKTATITITLTGDLSDARQIVVSYGTSEDELTYGETIDTHHEISSIIGSQVTVNLKGLTQGTTYYIKVFVKKADGNVIESRMVTLTTEKNESFPVADIVDMGMPSGTKWSSWNMGASSPFVVPTDAYYVWGDAEGTVTSTSISDNPYFKNTPDAERGKLVDIAGTVYDIATQKWGEGWQLPTLDQFKELINFSDTKYVKETIDGKEYQALKVVSKRNGATIYLPCGGLMKNNVKINGNVGYFWTSRNGDVSAAIIAQPSVDVVNTDMFPYMFRLSVRPVYVGKTSGDDSENQQEGTRPLTSAGRAAKAVDLGLEVKWATYNVGAIDETEAGYYVSFGDTLERSSYTISDYIHYDAATQKYTIAGMNPLKPEYDAANCQWGGTWRMPTYEEWANLINHCDWVWEGNGYRVYKKGSTHTQSSPSIFLPVTGYKVNDYGTLSHYFRNQCIYWVSQYNTLIGKEGDAYIFRGLSDNDLSIPSFARYFGICVRPVKP